MRRSSITGNSGLAALVLSCIFTFTLGQEATVPVYLSDIELETTHEWFLERPEVYFQCEGEPKKFLTGVVEAHKLYRFTFHESFQPLTELEVPKCKRCGLYEKDFFTEDDTFDKFELCPLDFSEPPEGKLKWSSPKEVNLTMYCQHCNTRNSYAGGAVSSVAAKSGTNYILLFGILLSIALGISLLVVAAAYCIKEGLFPFRRRVPEDAKFMQMSNENVDFLEDDDFDIELAEKHGVDKHD